MKKMILMAVAAMFSYVANAQDTYYGSKEGGFAVTLNANPLLNYAGNMFNGTTNNSLQDFNGLKNSMFSGTTITGKYMLKDNISVDLGFGFDNKYNTTYAYSASDFEEEQSYSKVGNTAFMLKAGASYLLRPGERLQPILSAALVYCHANNYTYSEALTGPTSEIYNGAPVNKLGIMASVGVEYFVMKQMSIGATVDFGLHKTWNAQSYDTNVSGSSSNGDGYRVNTTETKLATSNYGGNISLNFYF